MLCLASGTYNLLDAGCALLRVAMHPTKAGRVLFALLLTDDGGDEHGRVGDGEGERRA
jgi:hypothetical protein